MFTRSLASPCSSARSPSPSAPEVVADAVVAGDQPGDGLVDQLARPTGRPASSTDSSIALWATVPRAVCGVQANASSSWARNSPSQPCTELSRCFDTQSVSPVGHPRRPPGPGAARGPSRSSARSRGSNSGRSWGRAPERGQHLGLARGSRPPPETVTPAELNGRVMQQSSSLRFARAVQALAQAARALGLVVPGFRSPPRLVGVQRSIKRWPGGATVAVVVRDRPWPAVQADLVEGVVAANAPRAARRPTAPGPSCGSPSRAPRPEEAVVAA